MWDSTLSKANCYLCSGSGWLNTGSSISASCCCYCYPIVLGYCGLDSNHKGINCLLAAKNSAQQHESHTSAPIALPGFFVNGAGWFLHGALVVRP